MNKKTLAKNAGSMSIAVFISRILGLLRDVLMTGFFGTSVAADAFQVAYQIPNLLRKLFGEGALSAAFIPIYNEIGQKKGKSYQLNFALNILSLLAAFLMILSALGVLFAPFIVKILAPGLAESTYLLAVDLTRLLFPYLFLIGFASTLISILNSHGYFFIPGLSSAFLNIAMLSVLGITYLLNPDMGKNSLIYYWSSGVLVGGVLQVVVNLPLLKKVGYRLRINLSLQGEALSSVWKRFLPGVLGLAIRQVNLAVDLILASFLVTGSIASLNYGNRIMQLPLGIIGVSAGVAVLPLFSRLSSNKQWEELGDNIHFSLISLAIIMIPITAFMIAIGEDITRLIFFRGAFNEESLRLTYLALVCYSSGLFFYSANRIIIPVFYAQGDTRTPVKIAAYVVLINISLNIILMSYFAHAGLALATAISAVIHYFILRFYLKNKSQQLIIPNVSKEIFKVLFVSMIILISLIFIRKFAYQYLTEKFISSFFVIILSLIVMIVELIVGSKILKLKLADQVLDNLWKRFKRKSKLS